MNRARHTAQRTGPPRPSRPSESPKPRPIRTPSARQAERVRKPPPPPRHHRRPCRRADQNLAEMAQRLEAALRRPAGEAARTAGRRAAGGARAAAGPQPAAQTRPRRRAAAPTSRRRRPSAEERL